MLLGMELLNCPGLAVPAEVMHHVVNVESSYNPYAIGVVGGRLVRQPKTLQEAVATARMLESRGYNFSLGLAQVNRYNLAKYGLSSYEKAFETCPNLQAGSRILAECHQRSGADWGKSFSCYYSGNFTTGYKHGYVQKIFASMTRGASGNDGSAIALVGLAPTLASKRMLSVSPGIQSANASVPAQIARRSAAITQIAAPTSVTAIPSYPQASLQSQVAIPQAGMIPMQDVGAAVPTNETRSPPQPAQAQGPLPDQAFVF